MIDKLLTEYRRNKRVFDTSRLRFAHVGDCDVYNISREIDFKGRKLIFGRIEHRQSESSTVKAFEQKDGIYCPVEGFQIDNFQDPCVAKIGDELILGGTKTYEVNGKIADWNTSFYRGKTLLDMRHFADAPRKMKDARIFEYNGKIGVFSRPQGGQYKGGRIGIGFVNSIDDVCAKTFEECEILPLFDEGEWGGVNEVHVLNNGYIGALGHIARMSEGNVRHYYAMVFVLNKDINIVGVKIIAERADFVSGEYKRKDLIDVLFAGGLNRIEDNKAILYSGVSDAEAHYAVLPDPFSEYEN